MPDPRAASARISDVPDSCTCTWSYGPPAYRWKRIGVKEDCPWHTRPGGGCEEDE
jgi:hypothetical protein